MSHKLVNDAIFYIGGFLDSDELVPARFVNKQWEESLGHIDGKKHHVKPFLSSVRLYEWAREALGMPEAGREDMLKSGCLELVVQWCEALKERDEYFQLEADDIQNAAGGGCLPVLQWLRAQDPPCPWDERTCSSAAEGGHLHILQWLRAQDPPCPWDNWSCARAANGGHLHMLQWLRAQDPPCPWDEETFMYAADKDHVHVLDW